MSYLEYSVDHRRHCSGCWVCDMADELDRRAADTDALDLIAGELCGRGWSADVVEIVAEIVRATGRAVDDVTFDNLHRCEGCGVTGGGVEFGRCSDCAEAGQ